jgi:hypothetical protein
MAVSISPFGYKKLYQSTEQRNFISNEQNISDKNFVFISVTDNACV